MKKTIIASTLMAVLALSACSEQAPEDSSADNGMDSEQSQAAMQANPLMERSPLIYQTPQFDLIEDEHFLPAIEEGMRQELAEMEAIANNPDAPTFENTLVAMETSGELLTRATRIFYQLAGTDSNDARRAIQRELAPKMAGHSDDIYLNPALFERVETLYNQRDELDLDAEGARLLDVYYERFVRAGARLNEAEKQQIRALNEEHSRLTTQFGQNLLAETQNIAIIVDSADELDGMSEREIATAAKNAADRGEEGKYLINLTNTTRQPVLAKLHNRELRQRIWETSANRAQAGETDNREISARLVQLRAQRAELLGYDSWANYVTEPQMSGSPEAVFDMLNSMLPTVLENTKEEQRLLQEMADKLGHDIEEIQAWDWAYYADMVREEVYDVNDAEVSEYFEFNRVLHDGVFYTMEQFYGVTFEPRPDLPTYHEDVEVYEMFDSDGTSMAIFYADYFARDGKRGGAWMSSFVGQSYLLEQKPVVINVMNIPKASEGPTLVSYSNVTTMFHELGHGIHGMFSKVNYPSLAGTAVSRDYVEFPSTFEEDWAAYPQVIENYARHYETDEPMPKELLDKVLAANSFNMGFDTLEYLSASLLDMEWHSLGTDAPLQDVAEFEQSVLEKYGIDMPAVPPRYRTTYFSHSMGGGYSANYYAYIWSEILAADAFAYVQELGGLDREVGDQYRRNILEVGNSIPPMEAYKNFRGQEPTTDALLIRRGLKQRLD